MPRLLLRGGAKFHNAIMNFLGLQFVKSINGVIAPQLPKFQKAQQTRAQ